MRTFGFIPLCPFLPCLGFTSAVSCEDCALSQPGTPLSQEPPEADFFQAACGSTCGHQACEWKPYCPSVTQRNCSHHLEPVWLPPPPSILSSSMGTLQGIICLHLYKSQSWPGTHLPQTYLLSVVNFMVGTCFWHSVHLKIFPWNTFWSQSCFSDLSFPKDFSPSRCSLISTGRGINTWTNGWVMPLDVMMLRTRCYLHFHCCMCSTHIWKLFTETLPSLPNSA